MILKGVALLGFGLLFVLFGRSGWKQRRENNISLIEAVILKVGNAEPLPLNRWDRAMAYAQPILMLAFGTAMVVLGVLLLSV